MPLLTVFEAKGAAQSRRHALAGVRFAALSSPLPRHAQTGAVGTRCPSPLYRHACVIVPAPIATLPPARHACWGDLPNESSE